MAKITSENKKDIQFDIKELNLRDRGKFNNLYHKEELSEQLNWTSFEECCLIATKFTEDELNKFKDIDIILIAKECYFVVNKKKLKKSS